MTHSTRPPFVVAATGALYALLALVFCVGGAVLLWRDGSAYYLIAGAGLLLCAGLVWRGRRAAQSVSAALLLGTLAWSVWEVQFDWWQLLPRIDVWFVLAAWLLVPVGWLPSLGGRPGSYKVGGWYNTSNGADLLYDVNHDRRGTTGLDPLKHSGQYGVYVNFQQQITGIAGARGATVFLNVSQADRHTAAVDGQVSMGVQYQGPFERPRDAIGFAVGATHNNGRFADFVRENNVRTGQRAVAGDGNEYVAELYYSWSPIPSLYVRPNLQHVLHPGGTSANRNAFVVGLKSGIAF